MLQPHLRHHAVKSRAGEPRTPHGPHPILAMESLCYGRKRIGRIAVADSNSMIAWHRVQLKKNRAALKKLEVARFTAGHDKLGETQKAIDELARKIAESERCISAYERQTRRPLGTDFSSLKSVSWGDWNAHTNGQR
jgi:hypothetical protein